MAETRIQDFMPGWSKMEAEFKKAIIQDLKTKKTSSWPYLKSTDQLVYEMWLDKVVNPNTGEWYPERKGPDVTPVKGSGAKYVVTVIVRFKVGKNEYLCSKGRLEGWNAADEPDRRSISYPERWLSTRFGYKRTINEKNMTFETICTGPNGSEMIYELPISAANVRKLFDKSDGENVKFVCKADITGESFEVKWSLTNETLKLFQEKSFSYLVAGDYIPLPVRQELRAKAEQQGLIPQVHTQTRTQIQTQEPPSGTYS